MQLPNEEQLLRNKHKKECRDQLLESYIPYVERLAMRYGKYKDDLFGEGMLGLLHAIETYDPKKTKGKFISYARYWILHYMNNFLIQTGVVNLPSGALSLLQKYYTFVEEFFCEHNREPTAEEVLSNMRWKNNRYIGLMAIKEFWSSLDSYNDCGFSLSENLSDNNNLMEEVDINIVLDHIYKTLQYLDSIEYQVIIMKFFHHKTSVEIGKMLGYGRQRIEQILKTALDKLRKYNEHLGD